jgi:hypothetical protein
MNSSSLGVSILNGIAIAAEQQRVMQVGLQNNCRCDRMMYNALLKSFSLQLISDAVSSTALLHLTPATFSAAVDHQVHSSRNLKSDWVSQPVYWESFSLDPWEVCLFDLHELSFDVLCLRT